MLTIADRASGPALGGTLRRLGLDEFAQVDPDWAHKQYFNQGTAVWVLSGSAGDSDRDGELVMQADLIRLAAIALLETPLASPRLSIRYFGLGEAALKRVIGPFERTLLLQDRSVATADSEALGRIGELAGRWQAAGYHADHPVFGALDAFGTVYTAFNAWPELKILPPMAAMEGIFALENAPGIARRMTSSLAALFPSDPALAKTVRRLYDLRSDIIHGRPLDRAATEAIGAVPILVCRATLALMARAVEESVPPEHWTAIIGSGT